MCESLASWAQLAKPDIYVGLHCTSMGGRLLMQSIKLVFRIKGGSSQEERGGPEGTLGNYIETIGGRGNTDLNRVTEERGPSLDPPLF